MHELTLINLVPGSRVCVFDSNNQALAGTNSSSSTFSYRYSPLIEVRVVVFHLRYVWWEMKLKLTSGNTTIFVPQVFDRNYVPLRK
jgi:hypothetical protein